MVGQRKDRRGRKARFVPRVEGLEDRAVPTVIGPTCPAAGVVIFSATPAASGSSNTLNLFDNGAGLITFNTGKTTDPAKALPAACGPVINEIVYNASTGSDTVTYNMVKNATLQEDIKLLVQLPSAGNKGFALTVGTPHKSFVPGSPGTPPVPPVQAVPVNIAGHLTIDIEGGISFDNATLSYAGQLNGRLDAFYHDAHRTGPHAHGLEGDKVSFTFVPFPKSTGTLHPKLKGGVGDDSLTLLTLRLDASPRLKVTGNPQIDGDAGLNTGVSNPPITMVNV